MHLIHKHQKIGSMMHASKQTAMVLGLQILLILQVPSTAVKCIHKYISTNTDTWKHYGMCSEN